MCLPLPLPTPLPLFYCLTLITAHKTELPPSISQALTLFVKLIRKFCTKVQDIQKAAISATIPVPSAETAGKSPIGSGKNMEAAAEAGIKGLEADRRSRRRGDLRTTREAARDD